MWNPLLAEGKVGQTLLTAWIAKECPRNPLALARTSPDRHQVGQALWKFLIWCADADIPEVRTLAATVDRWWIEIAAFIDTGHSNAKSEGINRMIKLVARNAFGLPRTPGPDDLTNERLRPTPGRQDELRRRFSWRGRPERRAGCCRACHVEQSRA